MAKKNEDGSFEVTQAVYSTEYGSLCAFAYPMSATRGEYVQLSEPFTVTVQALPPAEVLEAQVVALHAQKDKLQSEYADAVQKIEWKLSELLCLTHTPE